MVKAHINGDDLRTFSIKCWADDFGVIDAIADGDVVRFTRLWRKTDTRRQSNNYRLNANEVDVELFVWKETTATVVHAINDGEITDFAIIRAAMENARVVGEIDGVRDQNVVVLRDAQSNLMEVVYEHHNHVFVENSSWTFIGNIALDSKLYIYI